MGRRKSGAASGPNGARLLADLADAMVEVTERLIRLEAEWRIELVRRQGADRQRKHRARRPHRSNTR